MCNLSSLCLKEIIVMMNLSRECCFALLSCVRQTHSYTNALQNGFSWFHDDHVQVFINIDIQYSYMNWIHNMQISNAPKPTVVKLEQALCPLCKDIWALAFSMVNMGLQRPSVLGEVIRFKQVSKVFHFIRFGILSTSPNSLMF